MSFLSSLLFAFLLSPPMGELPKVELQVIGVFRPIDLDGRTVGAEREIFLEAVDEDVTVPVDLVGAVLEVTRLERLPVKSAHHSGLPLMDSSSFDHSVRDEPVWKMDEANSTPVSDIIMRGRPLSLAPSEGLQKLAHGRPSAFAPPRREKAPAATVVLGARETEPSAASGTGSVEHDMPEQRIQVGELRVMEIRGSVVIAAVIADGLARKGPAPGDPRVTVRAGDRAIGKPLPKVVAKRESRSQKRLIKKLENERKQLDRDLRRKKRRPKPFRRKVMKWDL